MKTDPATSKDTSGSAKNPVGKAAMIATTEESIKASVQTNFFSCLSVMTAVVIGF